jgi:branched-chain amino acid transport system permease protein
VLTFGAALVIMMIIRPEGLLPSRQRRAELAEGTGGMGALGGEAGAVAGQRVEADEELVSGHPPEVLASTDEREGGA